MNKIGFFIKREQALKLVLSMYEGKPCRICGKTITDATKAVYAGYSKDRKSRLAHTVCWNKNIPQSKWAYPE